MYFMTVLRVSCLGLKSCQLVGAKQDGGELVLRKKNVSQALRHASEPAKEVQNPQPTLMLPTTVPLTSWNGQSQGLTVARGHRLYMEK